MVPKKRRNTDPLLSPHATKQRRTRMVGYDGGNPSPSEDAGLLSRWITLGKGFGTLTSDTLKAMFSAFHTQGDPVSSTASPDVKSRSSLGPVVVDKPLVISDRDAPPRNHSPLDTDASPRISFPPSTSNHPVYREINGPLPPSVQNSPGPSNLMTHLNGTVPSRREAHGVIPRKYRNREHIFVKAHKANVRAETQKSREEMQRQIWAIKRSHGYTSNLDDLRSLLAFQARLEKLDQQNAFTPSASMIDLHAPEIERSPRRHSASYDMDFLRRALGRAKATLDEPKPPKPFQPSLEQLKLYHRREDEAIEQLLRPKPPPPSPLSPKEDAQVDVILRKRGVISKYAREQVNETDLSRLCPGQWLNDEIINFYGALILGRSEDCKENSPKRGADGTKSLQVHYFSTFFWHKLKDGYEKGRLAKWTKKIDIFSKDVILIPVNHSNAHWTSAAINFRRRRIESFDSMGTRRDHVFKTLRAYLDAEHRNKKNKPFDFTGWDDYSIEQPQQENGYDCGVFTCQYLRGLSRGDEVIRFTQKDMPLLRRRMIWEIGNAKLFDEP